MAFEKLTGLVNLEELEKESDLFDVNGGATVKCIAIKTADCVPVIVTCARTCSFGSVFCGGTKQCGCCDDNYR